MCLFLTKKLQHLTNKTKYYLIHHCKVCISEDICKLKICNNDIRKYNGIF